MDPTNILFIIHQQCSQLKNPLQHIIISHDPRTSKQISTSTFKIQKPNKPNLRFVHVQTFELSSHSSKLQINTA